MRCEAIHVYSESSMGVALHSLVSYCNFVPQFNPLLNRQWPDNSCCADSVILRASRSLLDSTCKKCSSAKHSALCGDRMHQRCSLETTVLDAMLIGYAQFMGPRMETVPPRFPNS